MCLKKLGYVIKHKDNICYVVGSKSLGNAFATLWCSDISEAKRFYSRDTAKKWAKKRGLDFSLFRELILSDDGSLFAA